MARGGKKKKRTAAYSGSPAHKAAKEAAKKAKLSAPCYFDEPDEQESDPDCGATPQEPTRRQQHSELSEQHSEQPEQSEKPLPAKRPSALRGPSPASAASDKQLEEEVKAREAELKARALRWKRRMERWGLTPEKRANDRRVSERLQMEWAATGRGQFDSRIVLVGSRPEICSGREWSLPQRS